LVYFTKTNLATLDRDLASPEIDFGSPEAADDGADGPLDESERGRVDADLAVLADEAIVFRHVEKPFPDPSLRRQARAIAVRVLRAILNFTPSPMFAPSFTPRGEHSLLF
jgi:hypothetical protein